MHMGEFAHLVNQIQCAFCLCQYQSVYKLGTCMTAHFTSFDGLKPKQISCAIQNQAHHVLFMNMMLTYMHTEGILPHLVN